MRGETAFPEKRPLIPAAYEPLDMQARPSLSVPYPAELASMERRQALPSAQIRILMLRRFADPIQGEWETTTAEIVRLTRASRSTVHKALRALERARWLHIRYIRTNATRLVISFGGFGDASYLREGKLPLVWDVEFPNRSQLTPIQRPLPLVGPTQHRSIEKACGSVGRVAETSLLLKLTHARLLATLSKNAFHLRVNVLLPRGTDRLKVTHSYNMDEDPDRDLELGIDSGAAGRCWQTGSPVICDLANARATFATRWRMTDRQQARVRPSLRSLLSVPILVPADTDLGSQERMPIGILSFDSDHDLRRDFRGGFVQQAAAECAAVVSAWLDGRTAEVA